VEQMLGLSILAVDRWPPWAVETRQTFEENLAFALTRRWVTGVTTMSKKNAGPVVEAAASSLAYSDGHPQDRVQYLEAKLILKPDRFTSVENFRDFGKLVQRTAKNLNVGFVTHANTGQRPEIREIILGVRAVCPVASPEQIQAEISLPGSSRK
jgi:hypothetical protein